MKFILMGLCSSNDTVQHITEHIFNTEYKVLLHCLRRLHVYTCILASVFQKLEVVMWKVLKIFFIFYFFVLVNIELLLMWTLYHCILYSVLVHTMYQNGQVFYIEVSILWKQTFLLFILYALYYRWMVGVHSS